jgi:type VI secretion system protein ImpH
MDRPAEDRFGDFVGSLIGVGGPEWLGRDASPQHAKLFFAGLLSRQVRNADGLQSLAAGLLRVPVRVEPFLGRWMRLPEQERTRIGRRGASRRSATAQLGTSAVLGAAVFDRQHHFRLHVGPLRLKGFESLLPTGDTLPALRSLVHQYPGHEFGWDLQLDLDRVDQPACRLGRHSRLGWTSWLGKSPGDRAPYLILNPEPLQAPL